MKIAVTRCDGDTEVLVLNGPVLVYESEFQASIHSAEGMDHFFRSSDGKYDGYGFGAPDQGWTEQQAKTMLAGIQRTIIPATIRGILWQRARKAWQNVYWWYGHLMGKPGF